MSIHWFKPRGYRHFDVPVDRVFARRITRPGFAAQHSFSPFLHFVKETKQYRPRATPGKVQIKPRSIMYASHRDACILSYFASEVGVMLEAWYEREALSEQVIAYRKLGRANYHFAAEAVQFARAHAPCMVLAFDVSKFFDTLDHGILKTRLKAVLGVAELSEDWFAVYRSVTKYRFVDVAELHASPTLQPIIKSGKPHPLVSIRQLKAAAVPINRNTNAYGIPQGSPISSVLANIYMMEFDKVAASWCHAEGALYRRYSDDILIICPPHRAGAAEHMITAMLLREGLIANASKTERTRFEDGMDDAAQYLGFSLRYSGASIRPSSMSKQWRKLKRSAFRIEAAGRAAIASGKADKVFTKTLRRKFSSLKLRNFPSYARRSADEFDSKTIKRQTRRLERKLDEIISRF